MVTGTAQQLSTFGWMVITGAGVGLIFDLYRVSRGLIRPRWLLTALGDLLFWLLVAVLTYGVLLQVNSGEVRVFVFLGLFIGLFLYYRFVSTLVIRLVLNTILFLKRFLGYITRLVKEAFILPLYRLFYLLLTPLRLVAAGVRHLSGLTQRYVNALGRHWWGKVRRGARLLYRLLKYKLLFFTRRK